MRKRVHAVAKELGLTSKELIEELKGMGVAAKSPQSAIDEGDFEAVYRKFGFRKTDPAGDSREEQEALVEPPTIQV